ncbi:MAG: type I-E CRISPR-associated protein Cse2/CasB [Spirochaetia bacterium]
MTTINKTESFIQYVLDKANKQKNKGFAAKIKKADSEATEYQSWEILSRWVDLVSERDRRAYGMMGASAVRSRVLVDGSLGLGTALRKTVESGVGEEGIEKSPAAMRLRRLLTCKESLELLGVLRPVVRLLESKEIPFSRSQLLNQILWFDRDESRERTRTRWAQDFYRNREEGEE